MSEESKQIYAAFVKAQKEFGPALKTSTNPHFKSRYADLAAVVEAVIGALNDNGIAVVQRTHPNDSGVSIETVFLHESGELMSSGVLSIPASKHDAQGFGSAMTYARRYSLMAACGIAPEDDDGNAAATATVRQDREPHSKPTSKPPAPPPEQAATPSLITDFKQRLSHKKVWTEIASAIEWVSKQPTYAAIVKELAGYGASCIVDLKPPATEYQLIKGVLDHWERSGWLDPGYSAIVMKDLA